MPSVTDKPKPSLRTELCKGCGRCIEACNHHCIEEGHEVHPLTGLVPVQLHLERCTGCDLCVDACPEPFGLRSGSDTGPGSEPPPLARPTEIFERLALPPVGTIFLKGTYASAVGALLAGCRHFFGYPITPSTEGAELMAKLLPSLGGVFVQAVSEVAAINMIYGCGAAGRPSMTFTSSPGFSLMLEGISYMVGAELPGVIVNVMRGGPGLGNIGPEQADIKLACHGLGHGNSRAIVLAPASAQEMLDHTILAFELSFRYRNPVVVLCDGYLGQMSGRVTLPSHLTKPSIPRWAVWGDHDRRRNLVSSIHLTEADLEAKNLHLERKYAEMAREASAELFRCEDAEILLVACNTPARMAKGAVEALRAEGVKAGLFRPRTLWPFPVLQLEPLLGRARRLLVVEASTGQLEDEVRLALARRGAWVPPIDSVRRCGGILPQQDEILEGARAAVRDAGAEAWA
ncbi:MAG TPA: 3-methyl-2-oxobutanoate dehydrogenase subunit VorB [Vicinamibacteria bacterium]|nr:3-methyl-2-oxobutanoate dehydrogenase subunit VorB [Vicinamibacteria bacterium]